MNDEKYLAAIIAPLLKQPEELRIVRTQDDRGILLSVNVHKDDMGCLIGKEGETARSMRRLVRQYGMANKERISVKINEPESTGQNNFERQNHDL